MSLLQAQLVLVVIELTASSPLLVVHELAASSTFVLVDGFPSRSSLPVLLSCELFMPFQPLLPPFNCSTTFPPISHVSLFTFTLHALAKANPIYVIHSHRASPLCHRFSTHVPCHVCHCHGLLGVVSFARRLMPFHLSPCTLLIRFGLAISSSARTFLLLPGLSSSCRDFQPPHEAVHPPRMCFEFGFLHV